MGNFITPTGKRIIGTYDTLPGIAYIAEGSVDQHREFEYVGETSVQWDNQETKMVNGDPLYVDEDQNLWFGSSLTVEE